MAESYSVVAEETIRCTVVIGRHLLTVLVGFGLGSAIIYAAGGQPLAVILPANNLAAKYTQAAQGQFLQPLMMVQSAMSAQPPSAARLTPSMNGFRETNLPSFAQVQAFSPFDRRPESLPNLPPLSNEAIEKQIACLEVADDGDIFVNASAGPDNHDNRYWSLHKLPMLGYTDPNKAKREIEACKREFPNATFRAIAYDPKRQVQDGDVGSRTFRPVVRRKSRPRVPLRGFSGLGNEPVNRQDVNASRRRPEVWILFGGPSRPGVSLAETLELALPLVTRSMCQVKLFFVSSKAAIWDPHWHQPGAGSGSRFIPIWEIPLALAGRWSKEGSGAGGTVGVTRLDAEIFSVEAGRRGAVVCDLVRGSFGRLSKEAMGTFHDVEIMDNLLLNLQSSR